jgi:hypothetical protein
MKECIGKKIADIDDGQVESPFFRILLEDGSLIHIAITNGHQSPNLAKGQDSWDLSHNSLSWANVDVDSGLKALDVTRLVRPVIGTEEDPFGVGCKPEEFEDPNFLHGGIYSVSSESDLQGVLELLRTSLKSDQDSIVVHLSVYQGRNSCSRDLSDTENHPLNHTQELLSSKTDD